MMQRHDFEWIIEWRWFVVLNEVIAMISDWHDQYRDFVTICCKITTDVGVLWYR